MANWRKHIAHLATTLLILGSAGAAMASPLSRDVPAWLMTHVGTGEGQIAPVVLQRARDLYRQQVRRGRVSNPCYMAMDATRPSTSSRGTAAQRYYVICEAQQTFWAVSSGYGSGRDLPAANFRNGRECARHFSNAEGSNLTAGGSYLTAEARTSHRGYYTSGGQSVPFNRTFLVFDGMGETRNARERFIGGHHAAFVRAQCRLRAPNSPHADQDGFVRLGQLVDYSAGRSNGCTTWTRDVSDRIIDLVEGNPTSLYIYPESDDINAVARAVRNGQSPASQGLYWNTTCLSQIGAPQFWPRRQLEPVIRDWRASLTPQPRSELPICQ